MINNNLLNFLLHRLHNLVKINLNNLFSTKNNVLLMIKRFTNVLSVNFNFIKLTDPIVFFLKNLSRPII